MPNKNGCIEPDHIEKPPSPFMETADIVTSSEDYARRFSGNIGRYFLNVQTDLLMKLIEPYAGGTVLDVGGGHAQSAMPLVNAGFNVTVTGSSDICRNRLDAFLPTGSFTYLTCDSLDLPFEDSHFDVVIAFRLLPHVDQWQKLIKEMCRVSKKAVIIDYPDIRSFNILYSMLFSLKKKFEGNTRSFLLFSRNDLRFEFSKNNFGPIVFKPEFFFPMVIHRLLKIVPISKGFESLCRLTGLTYLFGSPLILRAKKL